MLANQVDYYLGIYVLVNGLYQWCVSIVSLLKDWNKRSPQNCLFPSPLLGVAQQKTHNFIY